MNLILPRSYCCIRKYNNYCFFLYSFHTEGHVVTPRIHLIYAHAVWKVLNRMWEKTQNLINHHIAGLYKNQPWKCPDFTRKLSTVLKIGHAFGVSPGCAPMPKESIMTLVILSTFNSNTSKKNIERLHDVFDLGTRPIR